MFLSSTYRVFTLLGAIAMSGVLFAEEALLVRSFPPEVESSKEPSPIYLWQEKLDSPRPLVASLARIDLLNPNYQCVVMMEDDPDGNGPAEASLAMPETHMKKFNAIVGINANAFGAVREEDKKKGYYLGMPVNIVGLAASNGIVRSQSESKPNRTRGEAAFWQDDKLKPHLNIPASDATIHEGVGRFVSTLLIDGEIARKKDKDLHPRTAIGLDASGRYLLLVVIDGRRKDYSEGVTLYELAEFMQSHGCANAINLDGGGSSIMMFHDMADDELKAFNRPSGGKHRPIPVMLGVRAKTTLQ